jgi:rhamnosyltransferase
MNAKVSIIVRTKNEERWIAQCLSAIEKQSYKNREIILVDNDSSDKTVQIASNFDVKHVNYTSEDGFKPGRAINLGIEASDGEFIVIISGHCIPTNDKWLETLIANIGDDEIAGVYGRQEPLSFTSNLDKRDLAITFGLDKKIQVKDPFFHNANSAISRSIWEKFPFDNECTNIEDRIWGLEMISAGKKIVYEPEASVFHHHGIHHGQNEDRANNIVRIMESLTNGKDIPQNHDNLKIAAFIPIRGDLIHLGDQYLLKHTIDQIVGIEMINEIVVATDSPKTAEIAKMLGATKIIMRPIELSEAYVGIAEVIKFTLDEYEKTNPEIDLIVFLEETYPFRNGLEIEGMIKALLKQGSDSLIAVTNERKGCWFRNENKVTPIIEQNFMPRDLDSKGVSTAQIGYCTLLRPQYVRFGDILGPDVALFNINKSINCIEIRGREEMRDYLNLLGNASN